MALDRYLQLDPERDGPLAGVDLDRHLRQALCDKASACAIVICWELVTCSFCTHAEPAEQVYNNICMYSLSVSCCLQDPSVMSAALCALQEAIQRDPKPYKNLIPSFVSILKQVSLTKTRSVFYSAWTLCFLHQAQKGPCDCRLLSIGCQRLLITTAHQLHSFRYKPGLCTCCTSHHNCLPQLVKLHSMKPSLLAEQL